ncbi:cysteine--tRNA ligase [soil metagenome]
MIQIFNTLTRKKETLKPIIPGKLSIYVCGMTVYDYCHIGHARVMVVFDTIIRYLKNQGYEVTYVRNITDVDDKIIKRAQEKGEEIGKITQRFITALHEDAAALNVLPPDQEPRVTRFMDQIIQMIQVLLDKGFAYVADNGDVYYDVQRFKKYGQLAHKDMQGLQAGARVEVVNAKHNPLDFVLWKLAKLNEPAWVSPWGEGRPGWHIECSAMATECLGAHFDIHGGGLDLQFPHHENEIAQSEAATDEHFVNTWMHVGFVQINKEKMSKSLGNFFTIREVLNLYPAEVIRYFMIATHYRSPVSYSEELLDTARKALERFYLTLRDLPVVAEKEEHVFSKRFFAAMNDDFNTPEAVAVLFDISHEINRLKQTDMQQAASLATLLKRLGGILGILQQEPLLFLHAEVEPLELKEIEDLIKARNDARAAKDWVLADKVRQQLISKDVILEDKASGTVWRKIR